MTPIKVAVYGGGVSSLLRLRLLSPLKLLEKEGLVSFRLSVEEKEDKPDLALAEWADVVIIQKMRRLRYLKVINTCRKLNKASLYEIDDNIFHFPPGHPDSEFFRKIKHYRAFPLIRRADAVIASTTVLRDYLKKFNRNIYILPNYIDTEIFGSSLPQKNPSDVIIIGYAGGRAHAPDFEVAEEALKKILAEYKDKIKLKFYYYIPEEFKNRPDVEWHPEIREYDAYAKTLKESRCDIGLAPLKKNFFNECKTNIKYLEYGVCGMAGIYSKLAPYDGVRDGETGLIAQEHTGGAWYHAIKRLVENHALREKIKQNAFRDVSQNHFIQHHYMEWHDVYTKCMDAAKQKK